MSNNSPKNVPTVPVVTQAHILKNGSTHHKNPKFLCKICGCQFIENPQNKLIYSEVKETIQNFC
jgi:transposase-like protein